MAAFVPRPEVTIRRASRARRPSGAIILLATFLVAEVGAAPPSTPVPDGEALFVLHCADCHGRTGRGDGPDAFLFTPPPRNLRKDFLEDHDTQRLVRRILDGAALQLPFDPKALRAHANDTEAIVAHLHVIPQQDWRLIALGQRLYLTRCQACHGVFGRAAPGTAGSAGRMPPDLSTTAAKFRREADLLAAVRHDRPGMTRIPPLPDESDARALVAFVRVFSPGFSAYSRYCAVCHGDDGHPAHVVEPARRPRVVFDAQYLKGRDPEALRVAVWHMLEDSKLMMPHFRGALSESGARAIIEYLRGTH
jgi:mono/diheme cytochrome c family protein